VRGQPQGGCPAPAPEPLCRHGVTAGLAGAAGCLWLPTQGESLGGPHSPGVTLGGLQLLAPPAAAPQSLCAGGTAPRGLGKLFFGWFGVSSSSSSSSFMLLCGSGQSPALPPPPSRGDAGCWGPPDPAPPPSNRRRRRRRRSKPPSLPSPPQQQGSDWVPGGSPRANGVSPFFWGGGEAGRWVVLTLCPLSPAPVGGRASAPAGVNQESQSPCPDKAAAGGSFGWLLLLGFALLLLDPTARSTPPR